MSNLRKRLDRDIPDQMDLFEMIRKVSESQKQIAARQDTPGRLHIETAVKELITAALKKTPLSRHEVAAEMSRKLDKEITKAQIDSWSAESKENHGIKVAVLNAFMESTGDKTILHLLCENAGGYFIEGEDALYTELGKIEQMKKELSEKEKLVKQTLERLKR
jgi:hypothetical protein